MRGARLALLAASALALAAGPAASRALAQQPPPTPNAAPGLDLAGVIQATLDGNPDILIAAQQADSRRGALLEAAAPFDLLVQAASSSARQHSLDPDAIATAITQTVSLRRLFRNGILVAPDLTLERNGLSTLPHAQTPNDLSAGVTVGVPLLRDRGGIVSTAAERAAARDYAASLLDLKQTTSLRVLTAVVAYWDYVAATQRLDVYTAAEQRAARSADETAALVKADERTSADQTQTLGNLSSKRVARIAAEQGIVEARQTLGLAMALPLDMVLALPRPTTGFPALPPESVARRTLSELLAQAYANRADLASSEEAVRSAAILTDASRRELRPRLDLLLGTGYRTRELGGGFSRYFAPLVPDSRGLDASVRLSYEFAPVNSGARGRLLQAGAAETQQRIAQSDLRRRVTTGVAVALSALQRGEASMRESEEAVRLLEATVQAEERKFQFGVSTLFDVIFAQDSLTSALLGRIDSQRAYAVAIASLRYQSGLLLHGGPGTNDRPSVDPLMLITPP